MKIYASDLDQTLIFSERFINNSQINLSEYQMDIKTENIEVELLKRQKAEKFDTSNFSTPENSPNNKEIITIEYIDEKPASFVLEEALQCLKMITNKCDFIPATTRTIRQFERILLKENQINFKYAVVSNGGNILIDGNPDVEWNKKIKQRIGYECPSLEEIDRQFIKIWGKYDFIISKNEAEDLFIYYIIEPDKLSYDMLQEIKLFFENFNWDVSLQIRKLYFTPRFLDKIFAIDEIIKRIGKQTQLICSGDSYLDMRMLLKADLGLVPRHGELLISELCKLDNNIFISKEKGLKASLELLERAIKMIE